jgi:hypothetical protein
MLRRGDGELCRIDRPVVKPPRARLIIIERREG